MRLRQIHGWPLVATAVLFAASTSLVSTNTADASSPTTVLGRGVISHHAFTTTFALAGGALTVSPAPGSAPALSTAQQVTMWSTYGLGGVVEGIGFGLVTVNRHLTRGEKGFGVTTFHRTPAFVGLAKGTGVENCPLMRGRGDTRIPLSQGWTAVIVPTNPHDSDALFSASSNRCGKVGPSTIVAAQQVLSVAWHLSVGRHVDIVASAPACAAGDMAGGGGRSGGPYEFQVYLLVRDRPLGVRCAPATNIDEGPAFASPTTVHGFTGPVRQVAPGAGSIMTRHGVRMQPVL